MKKFNQKIGLLCMTTVLLFSTCSFAFAGEYQDEYNAAAARGDVAGMQAAHDKAVAAGQSNCPEVKTVSPPATTSSGGGGGNTSSGSNNTSSTTTYETVYQKEYADAQARGDTAGMQTAHEKALAAGVSNNPNYTKNADGSVTTASGNKIAGDTSTMTASQLYIAAVATDAYYTAKAANDTSGEARAHNMLQIVRADATKASNTTNTDNSDKSVSIGTSDGSGTIQIIDANGNITAAGQEIINQAQSTYATATDALIQNAAHDLAEVVRNAAGYSGGVDGSKNLSGSYDHSGTVFVTDDAVSSIISARGLEDTAANREAARNEIAGYKAYEDPTAGTMWEGGIHYQYNAVSGKWTAIEELGGSKTMSQEDLQKIAALKTQQETQTAEFNSLNNKTNRTDEENAQLETLKNSIETTHAEAQSIRDKNGYTGGDDGDYVVPVIKNGSGSGSTGSDPVPSTTPQQDYYDITANSTGHGSISPNGTSSIPANSDAKFTITPMSGYKIKTVIVDGVSKGAQTSWAFYNVTSTHSITAVFISNLTLTTDSISVSGLTNGSIKAGYGFGVSVPCSSDGNVSATCTIGSKTYTMELVNGKLVLPRNPSSTANPKARVHYIPVKTASGTKLPITITVTATNKEDSSDVITKTLTASVLVKGNMYQDTGTGDR